MRYQSTRVLCEETFDEITCRVADVLEGRGMDLSRCRIPLRDQVVACLLILRQNLPRMVVADLLGISQPTISRIWRRITVLLEAVLLFLPGGLAEAIQQGHLILIDGTHAPYREPPSQRTSQPQQLPRETQGPVPQCPGRLHRPR